MTGPAIKTEDEKVRKSKRAFYISLFDLSWRLLAAMCVPLFIGLYIDSLRNNGQGFAYVGFAIGIISGAFVLRSVVRRLAKNV